MKFYFKKTRNGVYHLTKESKEKVKGWYIVSGLDSLIRLFLLIREESWKNNDGILRFGKLKVIDNDTKWNLLHSVDQVKAFYKDISKKT